MIHWLQAHWLAVVAAYLLGVGACGVVVCWDVGTESDQEP